MGTKIASVWLAFYFLASVHYQADADQLKICDTFKGELIIAGRNATAPLIIDGTRRIEGELTMRLYSGPDNSLFTSVSMKNLATVVGTVKIGTVGFRSYPMPSKLPIWNLGVLDFPALKSVGGFVVFSLDSVHTFNFPSLEHAAGFWFRVIPELHTIHAPKLTELGWLQLRGVPSLTTLPSFFAAKFKGTVGTIDISEIGLTNVSFPNIEVLSTLTIAYNKDLTTVNPPAVTLRPPLVLENHHFRKLSYNFFSGVKPGPKLQQAEPSRSQRAVLLFRF